MKSAPVAQLDWKRKEEFLQSVFMRSHSIHSRHFYESGLRRFKVFCREEKVDRVRSGNVYDVINSFVRWNDARGIRAKTIVDYICSVKRFLLSLATNEGIEKRREDSPAHGLHRGLVGQPKVRLGSN